MFPTIFQIMGINPVEPSDTVYTLPCICYCLQI